MKAKAEQPPRKKLKVRPVENAEPHEAHYYWSSFGPLKQETIDALLAWQRKGAFTR